MENTDKTKLIESYVPKLWMANTADEIRKILNDYSKACDSINCLEAKPKALHSMKCDEKSQDDTVSRAEIIEAIKQSRVYYATLHRTEYLSGLDKAKYIVATHGKPFKF